MAPLPFSVEFPAGQRRMTDRGESVGRLPPNRAKRLPWSRIEPFFREHGCVVAGDPELGWYREAWGALEKAGLTQAEEFAEFGLDGTVTGLRALCLLAMYLGIYQAAGERAELGGHFSGHEPCSRYLDSLGVSVDDLRGFGMLAEDPEMGAETHPEGENIDDGPLSELVVELVENESDAIFVALIDHYGDGAALFAALWNSRGPERERSSAEDILGSASPGDGRREVMSYVENGMNGWRLV